MLRLGSPDRTELEAEEEAEVRLEGFRCRSEESEVTKEALKDAAPFDPTARDEPGLRDSIQ